MSSSGSGTVINYGSGSDFLTSYGSRSGSGSTSKKVTVPVPQLCHFLPLFPILRIHAVIYLPPDPFFYPGLRIRDILVWIRIRGSKPLTNGSDSDPNASFLKDKMSKSHKTIEQGFFYYFWLMIEGFGSGSIPLTNGSGSRMPKIRWIRIRMPFFQTSG
jgi:hypothetical protein